MKYQALFTQKDESKKIKCPLLQYLFDALRVKFHELISVMHSVLFLCVCACFFF